MRTIVAMTRRGSAGMCMAVALLTTPGTELTAEPLFNIRDDVFSSTGGFASSASFALFGSASSGPATAQRLGLVAHVNQAVFSMGQTLRVTVGITNPGLPGTADLYVGIVEPSGTIEFFTSDGGIALGRVDDLASFRAIAVAVPLGSGFSVLVPNFRSRLWTGGEARGGYTAFLFAVTTGGLTDGTVRAEAILGIATAVFSFS